MISPSRCIAGAILLCSILASQRQTVQSFSPPISIRSKAIQTTLTTTLTTRTTAFRTLGTIQLNAKKKKKSNRAVRTSVGNRTKSSVGFGGGAVESCQCGSGHGYMKCCGRIHSDATAFANASAEAVVRARYTAYAKREIDFIIGSTHPLNKDFMTDIDHWKKTIAANCYDNFELKNCKILDETYKDEEGEGDGNVQQSAEVTFVATMTQVDSREKTSFMETSTFERLGKHIRGGAWMYKGGIVEPVTLEEDTDDDDGSGDNNDGIVGGKEDSTTDIV